MNNSNSENEMSRTTFFSKIISFFKREKITFLALVAIMIFGILFPLSKLCYRELGVVTTADVFLFAGIRFSLCGGFLTLLSIGRRGEDFKCVKGNFLSILLIGLFAFILHYAFTYSALLVTDASKSALIKQIGPLLYICLSFLFFKEDKLTVRKLVGGFLGFAGIIAINITSLGVAFSVGDVLLLLASLCTVFSSVIGKKVYVKVNQFIAAGISQLFGGLVMLLLGIAMGGGIHLLSPISTVFLILLCIASVVSYCFWPYVLKHADISKLFIIKFAEPLFACLFGAMLLGEDILKWQYLVAFVLICGGIVVANLKKKPKSEPLPEINDNEG